MYYASQVSIAQRYGEDFLTRIADRNRDKQIDTDPIENALRDTESEVDSYIGVVQSLPLTGVTDRVDPENNTAVPGVLRRVVVDMTVYRLASEADVLTKEHRRRYDDAVAWLLRVADSQISLGTGTAQPLTIVDRSGPDRIFTRAKMGGLI